MVLYVVNRKKKEEEAFSLGSQLFFKLWQRTLKSSATKDVEKPTLTRPTEPSHALVARTD